MDILLEILYLREKPEYFLLLICFKDYVCFMSINLLVSEKSRTKIVTTLHSPPSPQQKKEKRKKKRK